MRVLKLWEIQVKGVLKVWGSQVTGVLKLRGCSSYRDGKR